MKNVIATVVIVSLSWLLRTHHHQQHLPEVANERALVNGHGRSSKRRRLVPR